MGPKLGLRLIRGYKRFDTSLICTRTHGSTVNWRFNVRFKLFLTYNTYNYPVLDLNNFFFPMKTIESLGCGQYAGAAYLWVNTVITKFACLGGLLKKRRINESLMEDLKERWVGLIV